ncbi:MAG TPA: hypothetical protein VMM15_24740 [Bradyrhizobium sp.]|nr:hypothetical protein [Bradyrhizobium sp.]
MQALVLEVGATFAGDAAALVKGICRVMVRLVMAPVDRIANACDVAGVLTPRRLAAMRQRAEARGMTHAQSERRTRRRGPFGCLAALSDLT